MDAANNSPSGALKLSQILDDEVLDRLPLGVGRHYYRTGLKTLIDAAGLGDTMLSDINPSQLLPGRNGLSIRARLPFADASLFNWSAFFGGLLWLAWRRAAGAWLVIAALGLIIAALVVLEDLYGIKTSGLWIGAIFSVLLALFGTELVLVALIRDLKAGKRRKRSYSISKFALAVLAFLLPGMVAAIVAQVIVDKASVGCTSAEAIRPAVVAANCTKVITYRRVGDKRLSVAYFNRGLAHWRSAETDAAIDDFSQAIRIDPRFAAAFYNRALAFKKKGNIDLAIDNFSSVIKIEPRNLGALQNRGLAHATKGDPRSALADFEQMIRLNSKSALGYANAGYCYLVLGDVDAAIDNLDRAIELDDRSANTYNNRGLARRAKGNVDAAIEDYTRAVQLDASFSEAYANRAYAHRLKQGIEQAIADYSVAITLSPANTRNRFFRGVAFLLVQDYAMAEADFEAVLAANPKDAMALYGRGFVRARRDIGEAAEADMQAAQRMHKDVASRFLQAL